MLDTHPSRVRRPRFTGADLANLVNEAALNAARYNKKLVAMGDFELAKDKVLMGAERKSMVISNEEKRVTAYHEAGHTLVGLKVPNADPVHKVTIIPRGMALGVTQQLPEGDRHNYSQEYLLGQISILMGGRIAEETFLGSITTGWQEADSLKTFTHQQIIKLGFVGQHKVKRGLPDD